MKNLAIALKFLPNNLQALTLNLSDSNLGENLDVME